jgi:menaquinone-dependent protoporphyrinogen oxidase
MRTLIVYATKHGTAEVCANLLAQLLDGEVSICQLGKERVPPLDSYDQIIIGGPVYIGKIHNQVTRFISKWQPVLLQKRLGLFICCMAKGDEVEKEIKASFPAELIAHATATAAFGGCYNFDHMNWIEQKMIQMALKAESGGQDVATDKNIDKIDQLAISRFAATLSEP